MSYDLMVLDPADAPRKRKHFLAWFRRVTEWSDGNDYADPAATTPDLQAWYEDIRPTYRNMTGVGAPTDAEYMIPGLEETLANYSFAHHAIYATFAWSQAESVYPLVRDLAVKHKVGFYDVSGDEGDGEIYFPGDRLRPPSAGAWHDVAKQFKELGHQ